MREQTICISVHNGINYLPLAVKSVRENSYHKDCPFVIYSENSDDGTNEWLEDNKEKYNLDVYVETGNKVRRGIGGGMNYCADRVHTEFINFLQADIYVSRNWDKHLFECYDNVVGEDDTTSVGENILLENAADTGIDEYLLQETYIVGGSSTNTSNIDKTAQNELFDQLDDNVLDFTEKNPFGDAGGT